MKRGKLPESRGQRRKRLAQVDTERNLGRESARVWEERHREFLESYWDAYRHRLESDALYAHFDALQARLYDLPPPANLPHAHRESLEFERANQRMLDSHPVDWDVLIAFLERDPYTGCSGYLKEKILRRLKRAPLTETQKARLRAMLLAQVCKPPRREARDYCRLAIVLDEPSFRQKLDRLEEVGGVWAGWMLDALKRHGK
jgi:hypothetical protein